MSGERLDYLEEERKKLWTEVESLKGLQGRAASLFEQVAELKEAVSKKTSDYEAEAQSAARSAAIHKGRSAKAAEEAQEIKAKIDGLFLKAEEQSTAISAVADQRDDVGKMHNEILSAFSNIKSHVESISLKLTETETALGQATENLELAQEAKDSLTKIESDILTLNERIDSAHAQAVKKGREISKLHDEIFGYTYEDEVTKKVQTVVGLKKELDGAYDSLKMGVSETQEWLALFKEEQDKKYAAFQKSKNDEFEKLKTKVSALLPNAMTAGLSHAYQEKRVAEESEKKKASRSFGLAIFLLSATSVIPVAVSLYNLDAGTSVDQVIKNLPNLALGILPLYAPIFWLAMSANKRVKLAKRLIEEYAHKEALSKTFEGLSTQISSMDDDAVAKDLRARLLYNMVSLSAENPGSLIPDFNESDNPLFEALNKSLSLSQSLEKISAVPGIQLILKKVVNNQSKKQDQIVAAVGKATELNSRIESAGEDE